MEDNPRSVQRIVIVTGGELHPEDLQAIGAEEWVIGVDGGAARLLQAGVTPDLVVGDFDTAGVEMLPQLTQLGIRVKKLPREKALTDTQYAVEQALLLRPTSIQILGALGGARFDHALGNLFLLERIRSVGVSGIIRSVKNRLRLLIGREETVITSSCFRFVSLLPLSEQVRGVTLTGFRYPLCQATLSRGDTLGVSNELTNPKGKIEIAAGKLLVIESSD